MTHDIDDLLQLIKMLEERIIQLEKSSRDSAGSTSSPGNIDSYYWNHG